MVNKYIKRARKAMRKGRYSRFTPLIIIGLLVVIGGVWLILSLTLNASTPTTASLEASGGTLTGCATNVSDPTASGGQAVKFATCSSGLDESGNTLPDTNYAIPAGAIFMATNGSDSNSGTQSAPVLTLNRAVSLVPSGGTIVVRGGTYRDWYNSSGSPGVITKSVTIQAYPHEQPWFDGTNVIPTSSWTSDGAGHWYMNWSTPSFCGGHYYDYPYNAQSTTNTGPCSHWDMYYSQASSSVTTAAADPQMVYVNGAGEQEVTSLSSATGGAFYYDQTNKRIYISTNPSGNTIELAARPTAFQLNGANSKLRGIGFKRYASNEYNNNTEAAVLSGGSNTTLENNVFTRNAGAGLGVINPTGVVVNSNVFAFNGFDGAESNGHESSGGAIDNLLLENNIFNNNNAEGFGYFCSLSCSQAGIKMAHMDGYTAKSNIFENNVNAQGIWCDEACTNGVMVYNVARNNGRAGIFYEISDTGIIASNLAYGNGNTGIRVGSAHTLVYNNTVVDNVGGDSQIWVYDDPRWSGDTQGTQIGPDTTGVSVVNNIVSGVSPFLMWASGNSTAGSNTNPSQSGFFTTIDYNAYYQPNGSGQILWKWQIPTGSTYSSSVASFSAAHTPFDAHSIDIASGGDPFFVNQAGGNYNVRSSSSAYHSASPIPTDVLPGFNQSVAGALGLSTNTGYSRGAITWVNN